MGSAIILTCRQLLALEPRIIPEFLPLFFKTVFLVLIKWIEPTNHPTFPFCNG